MQKPASRAGFCIFFNSRADWIRTSDPYVPNVVRYRAALLPEIFSIPQVARLPLSRPSIGSRKSIAPSSQ
jgi:hypothetical protein